MNTLVMGSATAHFVQYPEFHPALFWGSSMVEDLSEQIAGAIFSEGSTLHAVAKVASSIALKALAIFAIANLVASALAASIVFPFPVSYALGLACTYEVGSAAMKSLSLEKTSYTEGDLGETIGSLEGVISPREQSNGVCHKGSIVHKKCIYHLFNTDGKCLRKDLGSRFFPDDDKVRYFEARIPTTAIAPEKDKFPVLVYKGQVYFVKK